MQKKRLLYFSAGRVAVCVWKRGNLTVEADFSNDETGLAAFSLHAASHHDGLFYLLADVVEEDFFQDVVPYVRGRDRRLLLERKLAQRYRDTTLALTATLGIEAGARREERVLFSSFTNTQQFQPWLTVLRTHQARLVGVYSVPFVSPQVVTRAGIKTSRCLLVSLQSGGLRQTFIEQGKMRFSRLGRIDADDARQTAETFVNESGRIQQYLTSTRLLPREAGALDVVVLAPAGEKALFTQVCVSNARLRFHVFDIGELAERTGLKSYPRELKAEALFLHLLAGQQPPEQYVTEPMRRFYRLWQARMSLLAGGAAVCVFCLFLAGLNLLDVYSLNQSTRFDREQEAFASRGYARLTESFPKTPTSTENLKATVKGYNSLLRLSASPQNLFVELSRALADSPQIELERISWEIGTSPFDARQRTPAASAPNPVAAPPRPGEAGYQVIEINGRVTAAQANDYRGVTILVNQFVNALKKLPGWEVVAMRLPFEIDSATVLRGGAGAARTTEAPKFSVTVSKRLGT